MIKVKDKINLNNEMYIFVPSNKEVYYNKKYINNNYNIMTLSNYLIRNYTGSKKLINESINYIIMYRALTKVSGDLTYYKDFVSYLFVKDLVSNYDDFFYYDLKESSKIDDLKIIYDEYERLLDSNNLINLRLLKKYMLDNFDFDKTYVFLDLEVLENLDYEVINKMNDVTIVASRYNNNLLSSLNISKIDAPFNNKYYFKEFNDIEQELEFVLNDIKSKLLKGYNYNDFVITSFDIENYLPYLDLIMDVPYTKEVKSNVLTSKFIHIFKNVINGDFTFNTMLSLLKLGVFNLNSKMVDMLDNYSFSWDLEDKSFVAGFKYNPNGNKKSFSKKDEEDLKQINEAILSINTPIMYLLKNTLKESNKLLILKEFFTYLSEENIIDKLYEKDYEGASLLVNCLEYINDYLEDETSISEIINVLDNIIKIKTKKKNLTNCILVSDVYSCTYEQKRFIYLVGASNEVVDSKYKPDVLISIDDIKTEYLIDKINEFNDKKDYYLSKCLLNENVFITYHKLSSDLKLRSFSNKFNNLTLNNYDNDKLYDAYLIKKDYATKLSNHKMKLYDIEDLNKINLNYEHNLKKTISKDSASKLYNNYLDISPSSIETYAKCPFYYFMGYALKLNIKEKYLFDNREVGTFVHYILENIIKNDLQEINKDNISCFVFKYADNYLEDNNKIVNNTSKYVVNVLAKATIKVIINILEELSLTSFKPIYTELKIKEGNLVEPVKIKLDNGVLRLSGVVDRLDAYEDNENYFYRIIDYKTGDKKFVLNEVINGLNLQMLLYLLAIKENKDNITDKKIVPSALFYCPALLKYDNESRFLSKEEKERAVRKRLKLNGIISKNIIKNTEEDLINNYYLITSRNKVSEEYLFDEESLELIFNNLRNTLKKIGDEILSGNISVDPIGGNIDSCKYCKFSSICQIDNKNDKKRKIDKLKNSDVIKMLEGDNNA